MVHLATNYTEALDMLYTNIAFDLVIMDVSAISRDVVVFLRQLKLQKNNSEVQVYITGCTDSAKFLNQLKKEKIEPAMVTGFLDDLMNIDTIIEPLSTKSKA